MLTSDFDYDLPSERIAKDPVVPRDHSRLMVLNRSRELIEHKHFYDLPDVLRQGDVLVLNDTKVFPARLFGRLETGGRMEVLLLDSISEDQYRVMAKPAAKLTVGRTLSFDQGLSCEVVAIESDGCRILKFSKAREALTEAITAIGHTPLPPYIKGSTASSDQYQTVFANEVGSSAAPTAGLHFTDTLFSTLRSRNIEIIKVTLHVGRGTFQDVKSDHICLLYTSDAADE